MNKLQIFKVLKIGFRVTNYSLLCMVEVHSRQESGLCGFREQLKLGVVTLT